MMKRVLRVVGALVMFLGIIGAIQVAFRPAMDTALALGMSAGLVAIGGGLMYFGGARLM